MCGVTERGENNKKHENRRKAITTLEWRTFQYVAFISHPKIANSLDSQDINNRTLLNPESQFAILVSYF